ncbi:hypothetical protein SAMN06265222_12312 [Neorhodopirellula lusitana]|uniref:Uncharacterized protein n=1 Tax=Neorhodopirellula lusitana TaxID=445327 RepID=A0ABY1QPL9_9BACT|nr:hypothetical protein SAMN06265222_12312 [Neorhodopirellula lusitana]
MNSLGKSEFPRNAFGQAGLCSIGQVLTTRFH